MRDSKPVLLVEDDSIDAMTVQQGVPGSEAHESAEARHSTARRRWPIFRIRPIRSHAVVLLDLNMPKMNGIEFLRAVKADPTLRKTPVIVLTTSSEVRDVVESFRLSAAGYVIKPVDYRNFVEAIRTIDLYWTLSELPEGRTGERHALCRARSAG